MPLFALVILASVMFGSSVFGLRGLLDIRDALRFAELNRLASPAHWQATRAWLGAGGRGAGVLRRVGARGRRMAGGRGSRRTWLLGGAAVSRLGAAARGARTARRSARASRSHRAGDGGGLGASRGAGNLCASCAGRRAAPRLERASSSKSTRGTEPLEALRALEQRSGLKPLAVLVTALRSAEKFGIPASRRCSASGRVSRRRSGLRGQNAWRAPRRFGSGRRWCWPSFRARSSCWRFRWRACWRALRSQSRAGVKPELGSGFRQSRRV